MGSVIKAFKPNSIAERYLLECIVNGKFETGSYLPPERELAESIGVTRTTLREVTSRLARDGWLTIRHGKPTRVNHFKETVTLSALDAMITLSPDEARSMVDDLFYMRVKLSSRFIVQAMSRDLPEVRLHLEKVRYCLLLAKDSSCDIKSVPLWSEFVASMEMLGNYLKEQSDAELRHQFIAWLDYKLFHKLARLSGNAVWSLTFNSLKEFYIRVSKYYYLDQMASVSLQSFLEEMLVITERDAAGELKGVMSVFAHRTAQIWEGQQERFFREGLEYERG
ncbi:fatty acid metabolism transcriptional regulator FadR [Vibrio owensii]|uniref:fatty acid metabolism transcriptional regulator FadR n=1 Tax=Vibrio owensii TaxID=696485 RepID=UPI0018F13530|nr:fatty acid metabolism transcriptional regulator FadR [Vibrio owensii]